MQLDFCKKIEKQYQGSVGKNFADELVEFILKEDVFRCCNKQLFFYRKDLRYYIPIDKQNEWHVISCFIEETDRSRISHTKADEIVNRLKDTYSIQRDIEDFNSDLYYVNLLNGVYSIKDQGLAENYKSPRFTYYLNVNYIKRPGRKMSAFEDFCKSSLGGDPIKRKYLLQMIGYCCTQLTAAKKCFILLGPPNCGKSLILHLIEYIVGEEYISSLQLEKLGKRFSSSVLSGKLLNICGELSAKSLKDIETFKLIVGGDRLSGEFKGKDIFEFRNKCKLLFAGNILPPVKNEDVSTAFADRISLLIFPDSIPAEKRNPNLRVMLEKEADSIFSEAIDTVAELIKKNYLFPKMEDAERFLADYSFNQTHIDNFIEEWCEVGKEYRIHTKKLYQHYLDYCELNIVRPISQSLFSQKINSVKGVVNSRFRLKGGESLRGFTGITLKKM